MEGREKYRIKKEKNKGGDEERESESRGKRKNTRGLGRKSRSVIGNFGDGGCGWISGWFVGSKVRFGRVGDW